MKKLGSWGSPHKPLGCGLPLPCRLWGWLSPPNALPVLLCRIWFILSPLPNCQLEIFPFGPKFNHFVMTPTQSIHKFSSYPVHKRMNKMNE